MYHRATIGILAVLVVVAAHSTYTVYGKKNESEAFKNQSEARLNNLKKREVEIKSQMQELETEAGREAEIRSKFNVVKDQENIVIILDNNSTTTPDSQKPQGIWQRILRFFGF